MLGQVSLSPAHVREARCKRVIDLVDKKEERRPLSSAEFCLRNILKITLHRATRDRSKLLCQRAKIKGAVLGDENNKFFHVSASQRFRKNKIPVLIDQGTEFHSHAEKAHILKRFYHNLLGIAVQTS